MATGLSLAELNARIREWEDQDDQRRITGRIRTIGQDLADERPHLNPLPAEVFDPGLVLHPRVDRSAMVTVRMAKYSVPARLMGRRVRVSLRASELVVFDGRTVVARHARVVARGGTSIVLDHYLEARAAGVFTPAHDAFWAAARKVNGDADGPRELIEVLLLHRSMTADQVHAGITAALSVGAVSADVVAVEARRHAAIATGNQGGANSDRHLVAQATFNEQRVVSLTQRRLTDPAAVMAGLPADTRPLPDVAAYDELLPRRTQQDPTASPDRPARTGSSAS